MKMKKKSWFFRFIFTSLFFFFIPFSYHLNQQTNSSFNKNFLTAKVQNYDDKKDNFNDQYKIDLVAEIEQKTYNDSLEIYPNQISQSDNKPKDTYSYFNDKDDKNDNEKKDSDTKHKVLISLLATLVLILTITLVTLTVKKVHEVKNPTNKPD